MQDMSLCGLSVTLSRVSGCYFQAFPPSPQLGFLDHVKSIKMKAKSNFNNKKKAKNTDILSAGSKVYAKKRKAKKETVESVEFDDASRT